MELTRYWRIVRRSLWIIVLAALLGCAGGYYYTSIQRLQYQSSGTIILNPSVPSSLIPYGQSQTPEGLAASYTELVHTRSFAEAVAKELSFRMSVGSIIGSVDTQLAGSTLFYTITARADSPQKAQELAAAVIKVLIGSSTASQSPAPQSTPDASSSMSSRLEDQLKYVETQIDSTQAQIRKLQAQLPSTDRDNQLSRLNAQLIDLQRNQTETILALEQIGKKGDATPAQIVDPPLPGSLVSPGLLRNLALGVALTLLIGFGLAFLRDYLDSSIHTADQLETVLRLPPAATVGRIRKRSWWPPRKRAAAATNIQGVQTELAGQGLVMLEDRFSSNAEAFRVLRASIQFAGVSSPASTLLVTSAVPSEGKSLVASNLAVAMAQAGKRVIVVDCDLQYPNLHTIFRLDNQVGLTSLLDGSYTEARVLRPIAAVPNLAVLTRGPLQPNSSELLSSPRADQVFEQLTKDAEIVIYDTPPVGISSDTLVSAARVDAVVLVVRADKTSAVKVLRAKQSLQTAGVDTILPVLNWVQDGSTQNYYDGRRPKINGTRGADGRDGRTNGKGPMPDATAPLLSATQNGKWS